VQKNRPEASQIRAGSVGVGLRSPHLQTILEQQPDVAWFELLADNHMQGGGRTLQQALAIRECYPVSLHCVGMSIGSVDDLNWKYLQTLKRFAADTQPWLISDHLCWTSCNRQYSHDLLPMPYSEEALWHVVKRINAIQDFLGVRIAVENVSSYLTLRDSQMSEIEFINTVAREADCYILLDLNNLYVNEFNHGSSAVQAITCVETERIVQLHLAGYEDKGGYLLDAHNREVQPDVWRLLDVYLQRQSGTPVMIEWDNDLPEFDVLLKEAMRAREKIQCAVLGTGRSNSHTTALYG
jgi:hypothetical protein